MNSPGLLPRAILFHVKPHIAWQRSAEWAGVSLSEKAVLGLERFRDWLVTEAVPAGGLGPSEIDRVDHRHIADSLLFARPWAGEHPSVVWDIGSGVGLPGIPLALCLPDIDFELVDRSGRRVELMRRAVRILDLKNVQVIQGDSGDQPAGMEVIVSRATFRPLMAMDNFTRLLASGGTAVIGGSWQQKPEHEGWQTLAVPRIVLARDVWLLMMRKP